ncbi:MAG: hypothetical protein JW747_07380 [Candidatus Aminicenantes bacterium]|nr:hypothetical protein [Candidatus Aminicenantes bacterium]
MTRKIFLCPTAALLILLAAGASARAQNPEPDARRAPRLQENIITLKLMRMTQVLELTEEQTAKIFPSLTRMEKEKFEISNRLTGKMRDLRALLRSEKAGEAEMAAAIEGIGALRLEIRGKDREADEFLKTQLSVRQYARYTLFLVDFHRGLEEKLNRARMMRTSPPSGTRKRPPSN